MISAGTAVDVVEVLDDVVACISSSADDELLHWLQHTTTPTTNAAPVTIIIAVECGDMRGDRRYRQRGSDHRRRCCWRLGTLASPCGFVLT
jgi:hypothetical protein